MSAITPRAISAGSFVFFECPECTSRAASMDPVKRSWAVEKIHKKLSRNADSYSAARARSNEAALQIVADFKSSGKVTTNPVEALAIDIMGPACRAEATKQAKAAADRDDAQWFEQNLHRYYRLRPVFENELDDVNVGYVPEVVLVIETEPGKRSKALIPAGGSAWPDEDEFLEGVLLAASEQAMPIGSGVKMAGWNAWNALGNSAE
jgi:hypothetical protein